MYIYRVYFALILFYSCIYIAHIYYFVLHLALYIITALKKYYFANLLHWLDAEHNFVVHQTLYLPKAMKSNEI